MNQNLEYSLTMRRIIVFVFLATFAEEIVGHPYAQLIPFRIEEQAPEEIRYSDPVLIRTLPEIPRAAIPGQFPCRTCPNQRASFIPNENVAPIYSIPGYSPPQRFVRSNVEAARVPVIENVEVPALLASIPSQNLEPAFMKSVRSTLEAMGLGPVAFPSELIAPARVEAPADATAKKTQSQNSQFINSSPEGYGMYYNMRVQSFNSVPVQTPEQSNTQTNVQAKESKSDEQSTVLAGIEKLLMGELMILSQHEEFESLAEQEFENQELYMKEIKRLLNIIRKTGDSKEKVGNLSALPESDDTDKVIETSENVTSTTRPDPDTASTVPTTTGTTPESIEDDESVSVQTTLKSRR